MKKTKYILFLFLIFQFVYSQDGIIVNKNGKINNSGTIRVKSLGAMRGLPDTLGGKMEVITDVPNLNQRIPNITYNTLILRGRTQKDLAQDYDNPLNKRPLKVLDTLDIESFEYVIADSVDVHAKGYTRNNSEIRGRKEIILNREQSSQQLSGNGKFTRLAIDNSYGVDIVNGGGFTITENLRLQRGELRNDSLNNFVMADSTTILRSTSSSLAIAPEFEGRVNVEYNGGGNITTGPEIPDDKEKLQDFYVFNSGRVDLNKNVKVNDELYVGTAIHTNEDTLSLPADKDPEFSGVSQEIHGAFARPGVTANDTIILNNPYTFAYFSDEGNLNGVYQITSIIHPVTFPKLGDGTTLPDSDEKVKRSFELKATDLGGNEIADGFAMAFGYAWRSSINPDVDETGNLNIPELILQRWNRNSNEWEELSSEENTLLSNNWVYSRAESITQSGNYAIGMPLLDFFVFRAKVLLQGAYNSNTNRLDQTLFYDGLLNNVNNTAYPYNLSPYDYANTIVPDSAVDWVVLEFRKDMYERADFYKTAFVDNDGQIIQPDGEFGIRLNKDQIAGNYAEYQVVIRHRNHLPVITKMLRFDSSRSEIVYDFTDYSDISTYLSEATGQLIKVDITEEGDDVFALAGGYIYALDSQVNSSSQITENTEYFENLLNTWNKPDFDGYRLYDFDMNGTITTRDFNLRWNNRDKNNTVPEIQ